MVHNQTWQNASMDDSLKQIKEKLHEECDSNLLKPSHQFTMLSEEIKNWTKMPSLFGLADVICPRTCIRVTESL